LILSLGILLLLLSIILALTLGAEPIPLAEIFRILSEGEAENPAHRLIVQNLRSPRALLALLVGASLALSGVGLQGLFRNPLADPSILGISSGAALGAALALLWALPPPPLAFLGAAGAGALLYGLAQVEGRLSLESLLLAGVALSISLAAGLSVLIFMAGEGADQLLLWLMGHMGGLGWAPLPWVLLCAGSGALLLLLEAQNLNALLEGEELALSLGVDLERAKRRILLATSLLVTGAVAFCGVIGFIGLIVPHALRLLQGPDHRWLLPNAALFGALILLLADTLARSLISESELPVGVITGLAGGPFFLWMLRQRLRNV